MRPVPNDMFHFPLMKISNNEKKINSLLTQNGRDKTEESFKEMLQWEERVLRSLEYDYRKLQTLQTFSQRIAIRSCTQTSNLKPISQCTLLLCALIFELKAL